MNGTNLQNTVKWPRVHDHLSKKKNENYESAIKLFGLDGIGK